MSIPKAVRDARAALGLTAREVAEAADVHVTHLMHFEAERKWMSRAKLERVLAVLKITLIHPEHLESSEDNEPEPLSDDSEPVPVPEYAPGPEEADTVIDPPRSVA